LSLAGLAATGSRFATQAPLVYLGEISYSTYMICIPWKILAVNAALKLLNIEGDSCRSMLGCYCRRAGSAVGDVLSHHRKADARADESLGELAKERRPATAEAAINRLFIFLCEGYPLTQ
jgi:hypothetical protein